MGKELFEFFKKMRSGGILVIISLFAVLLLLLGGYFESAVEGSPEGGELTALCLQIDGVGRCETLINRSDGGEVIAVAVVCDGAESLSVRENLYKLISSLYGVGYNRISILKLSK